MNCVAGLQFIRFEFRVMHARCIRCRRMDVVVARVGCGARAALATGTIAETEMNKPFKSQSHLTPSLENARSPPSTFTMAASNHVWTEPAPGVAPKPRTYTPEQQAMIDELREYAKSIMLPESDPYYEHERHWLLDDPECCGRYMRAAKWKLEDGKKRIQGTLTWRREYKPDLIPPEEVRIESETGKMYREHRNESTPNSPLDLLPRAIDFMPPHQDSMMIIVDYKSTTLKTNPSIGVARKVLGVLQQHYVERLGRAIVVNLPGILNFFYKGISPFLDPVTRDKVCRAYIHPVTPALVPASQLDAGIGGEFNYEFEPKSYWDQVVSHCKLNVDGSHCRDIVPRAKADPKRSEEAEGNTQSVTDDATYNTPALSPSASSRASTMVDETPAITEKSGPVNVTNESTQTTLVS
ncbi:CRAL/TRIO domain-containing protein [Rhizoctonia solani AG-1 IA]|uniref:CRAL/TRIO domain-containing protein n=1 Tax=Thanatephorus cucumeris (strain AG1-IA) TaxID=983506 RepID=L8WQQ8_THACA|nr:CRAL/TRIO domain-containing protein [Rhizoctonia solani AG-1 IA]